MKKLLLIVGLLTMGLSAQAGIDKGNGGSGSESILVGQQAQLESVALKIRSFFLKNEAELKPVFPEFSIQALAKKIKMSDIRVVNEKKLIDKHGIDRTCLNFSNSSLIECKSADIGPLLDQPTAIFVLVLHEYLGLIGVEETSPRNPSMIDGYKISKRIAAYVAKVNDYDLVIPKKIEEPSDFWPESLEAATSLVECHRVYNERHDQLVKERNSIEEQAYGPDAFTERAKLLAIGRQLLMMDTHYLPVKLLRGDTEANQKFDTYRDFCSWYGVKVIR